MLICTPADGREHIEGKKAAHLRIGASAVFYPNTKSFRPGEGRKLVETLKRFVSSGDFEAILVTNADQVFDGLWAEEAKDWVRSHAEEPGSPDIILSGIENL